MVVRDPIERNPCVEPLHQSTGVEIVNPEDRRSEAEASGNFGDEGGAERLVDDRDRPFESKRERRRWIRNVQPLVDPADASTRNHAVFPSSPRSVGDCTRKRNRTVDEEDPVRLGKARHVLMEAQPVRVPGHAGDADDVPVSKHHGTRSIHEG